MYPSHIQHIKDTHAEPEIASETTMEQKSLFSMGNILLEKTDIYESKIAVMWEWWHLNKFYSSLLLNKSINQSRIVQKRVRMYVGNTEHRNTFDKRLKTIR